MCRCKEKVTLAARLSSCFSLPTSSLYDQVSRKSFWWPEPGGFLPPHAVTTESRSPSIPLPVLQGAALQQRLHVAGHLEEMVASGAGCTYTGGKRETEIAGLSWPQLQLCSLRRLSPSFAWKLSLPGSTGFCCSQAPLFLRMPWLALLAQRSSCSENGSLLLMENAKANICVL